ncbi:MAG: cupin domain-containing protein [bacterium]|nr:cupin domain-containing protein [bacterium]
MKHKNAEFWIRKLGLRAHPEGGYYRETYRSDERIKTGSLPGRYGSGRAFSTAIYFLLKGSQVSKFHRLKSDEIWHYHSGSPLTVYLISPAGRLEKKRLGPSLDPGEDFQVIIKKGSWFGAAVDKENSYTLMGCTVAPGFDFRDFELADRDQMLRKYPRHEKIIKELT